MLPSLLPHIECLGLLLCLELVRSAPSDQSHGPIVETPWARFKGLYQKVGDHDIKAFLGIPYASPPVGILRFRETVPLLGSHKGLYHADHFRHACMQTASSAIIHAGNATINENCLFLNIWTPREASRKKQYSVLVYVHGSAHIFGSSQAPSSRGDFLAGFGDIVVVTMNYRLGAFGFAFDGHEDIPGNMAIHDIIQSLKWVQSNINYFGGDPDRVTLSGMSSGAIYSSMIFTTPSVPSGLFNKVVLMSGVDLDPALIRPPEYGLNQTEELSKSLGCSNTHGKWKQMDRKCLMKIKPEKIAESMENAYHTPIYGDALLVHQPARIVLRNGGLRQGLSILIGTEQDEDLMGSDLEPETKEEARNHLLRILHEKYFFSMNIDFNPLIDEYFADIDAHDVLGIRRKFHDFSSDASFRCSSLLFAEKFAEKNTVHLYRNEYVTRNDRDTSPRGTVHAADSRLFLGSPFRDFEKYDDDDRLVSRIMMETIGSFVKGQPLPWLPVHLNATGTDFYRWRIQKGASFETVDLEPDRDICWKWSKYFRINF